MLKGGYGMVHSRRSLMGLFALLVGALLFGVVSAASRPAPRSAVAQLPSGMQKRWLFVWRNMNDPKEVDRMIARLPRAQADGYNGVAFSYNIPPGKAAELKQAAKKYGLDLIAIVMGGAHDRNYVEGV